MEAAERRRARLWKAKPLYTIRAPKTPSGDRQRSSFRPFGPARRPRRATDPPDAASEPGTLSAMIRPWIEYKNGYTMRVPMAEGPTPQITAAPTSPPPPPETKAALSACPHCPRLFIDRPFLERHIESLHPEQSQPVYLPTSFSREEVVESS